ncbi:MAG: type III pantothenate kinase [Eggerthellaceae bacterium]|nr:type III pantothenate kinase [Eggerthellaceae bacterium]
MLLAVKVANAETAIGVFDGGELAGSWNVTTRSPSTADELGQVVAPFLDACGAQAPDQAILCSVVPALTEPWACALRGIAGSRSRVVGPGLKTGIAVGYKDPAQLGADRVACAVAARELAGAPVVVADFDAALTLTVVGADGTLLGGPISPGIGPSLEALHESAAQLPEVGVKMPKRVIARTTADAICAGVVHGEAARLDGLAEAIWRELGCETALVATGRYSELVVSASRHEFACRPDLALQGLRIISALNR